MVTINEKAAHEHTAENQRAFLDEGRCPICVYTGWQAAKSEASKYREELERLRTDNEARKEMHSRTADELIAVVTKLTAAESEHSRLREELDAALERAACAEGEIDVLREELNTVAQDIADGARKNIDELTSELSETRRQRDEARARIEKAKLLVSRWSGTPATNELAEALHGR